MSQFEAGSPEREELASLHEEDTVDTRCGYTASCKPEVLQKCANPKVYLVIISLCSIIQGFAVNGINNVNIASYERRYLLSSQNSSLVASFYDIAAGLTVIFVGYFGGSGHQPRYLGVGAASIGLGCFIMSMAHFAAPPYEPLGGTSLLCDISGANSTANCESGDSNAFLKNYLYVLLLGQALNGYGGTCLYTLGVTYVDQSVSTKLAPLYVGIMTGFSILGPAFGYILGGSLLNIYVDFPSPPPGDLTPSDPRWVGAWWLGLVISSVCSTILALFMFLFPTELPGTADIRAAKVSQAHDNGTEDLVNKEGFGLTFRDMPKATWYLLKNPAYMCITAVVTLEIALTSGFSTFLPKYISNQFGQTQSLAAILTGCMAVPGAAFGQFLGGYICKRFELKVSRILTLTCVSSLIVLVLTPIYWARCDDANLAGVLAAYPQQSVPSNVELTSPCNTGCGCSTGVYNPVCADGVQYFSPCHAGCSQLPITNDDKNEFYGNCSCPTAGLPGKFVTDFTEVKAERCPTKCSLLGVFIPIAFLVFLFTFMMASPLTIASLRVVPEKQRAFAIALQWVFLRFLGSIPGPIMFGSMIDASCSLWDDECGVRGSCWVYDNFNMSTRLFIMAVVLKVGALGFNILGVFLYKPPVEKERIPESQVMQALVPEDIHLNSNNLDASQEQLFAQNGNN